MQHFSKKKYLSELSFPSLLWEVPLISGRYILHLSLQITLPLFSYYSVLGVCPHQHTSMTSNFSQQGGKLKEIKE